MIVDAERSGLLGTAFSVLIRGERTPLHLRQAGAGYVVSGCGSERSAPRISWTRFDGTEWH